MVGYLYKWLSATLICLSMGRPHPLYISVTEVNHNAKDKILEVSCKLFTNDFEAALEKMSGAHVDLGSAALAMYVLIPAGTDVGVFRVAVVFIIATLLGFASHAPAGIGVFDATILIGLGGDNEEPLIAALLMFRLMYHFLPFILSLGLFGMVEAWRSLRRRRGM